MPVIDNWPNLPTHSLVDNTDQNARSYAQIVGIAPDALRAPPTYAEATELHVMKIQNTLDNIR